MAFCPTLVVLTAVLYRFWLTYPILDKLTMGQWRIAAILAAASFGVFAALLRLPTYMLTAAVAIGLWAGGARAGLGAPRDTPTTFFDESVSHLQIFWREILLLIAVSTVGKFWCDYLLNKNRERA